MQSSKPLHTLLNAIEGRLKRHVETYYVPGRWISFENAPQPIPVDPYQLWFDTIHQIMAQPAAAFDNAGQAWGRDAVIYNLFIRSGLAYDHDGSGRLERPNAAGMMETGTFVKAIMLLPYIKALGCNTVHLLPVTAIGRDGAKGDAGSPYAIRNHYALNELLAEPSLGVGVEVEFAAFIAVAHHLGLRIVLEFIFRTASIDADAIAEHPEWFYWIDATIPDREQPDDESAFGIPLFSEEEYRTIHERVDAGDFENLVAPRPSYRRMYLPPPRPEQIEKVDDRWLATYKDGKTGRVPGVFADYPPESEQPPWTDITFLRLYDHPDYNYIAYNTVRMYATELAQPQNRVDALWDYLVAVVPHYQERFGIDGAMVDMGHALPSALKQRIVQTARARDPHFAFFDENLGEVAISAIDGYDAAMGGLSMVLSRPTQLRQLIAADFSVLDQPLPRFGAPETHNSPRAAMRPGATRFTRQAFAICAFLPTVPFIHCGLEFGEKRPVNTGIDFEPAMIAAYSAERLPLFSAIAFDWANGDSGLAGWMRRTLAIRHKYRALITDLTAETVGQLGSDNEHISGILRRNTDWSVKLALIFNMDMASEQEVWMPLPTGRERLVDQFSGDHYDIANAWIQLRLAAGAIVLFEL